MVSLSRWGMFVVGFVLWSGCGRESNTASTTPGSPSAPTTAAGAAGISMGGLDGSPVAPVSPNGAAPGVPGPGVQGYGGQFLPGVTPSGQIPNAPVAGAPIPGAPGSGGTFPAQPEQPSAPGTAPSAAPGAEFVPAQAGVGLKGRSLDQHEGFIVTPAKTLFTAREKVVFEVAIPHSLNLYKATNGNAPRTHEEFMQKIVEEQQINLPQLPPGHRYVYDPQTEQLMVERPKK